jgi:hypothetical protein
MTSATFRKSRHQRFETAQGKPFQTPTNTLQEHCKTTSTYPSLGATL